MIAQRGTRFAPWVDISKGDSMAKQNEQQRSTAPRDSLPGDEERIRGVEDTGGLPEDAEDEDDFEDSEDVDDDEDEDASF
jgi:hypothetical protein